MKSSPTKDDAIASLESTLAVLRDDAMFVGYPLAHLVAAEHALKTASRVLKAAMRAEMKALLAKRRSA